MTVASLIRASSLTGCLALVDSLGGAAEPLLLQAGIPAEAVADTDTFIPYHSLAEVLEAAARQLGCPDFGLRLSEYQGLHILGPVGLIGRHSPSVGEAIAGIAQFMPVYSSAIEIAVDTDGPIATYHFRILPHVLRRMFHLAQIGELSLGTSLQVFRLLIGQDFAPDCVSFLHEPAAPLARYETFFGCPVLVAQGNWGFRFATEVLSRPVPGSDPTVRRIVAEYLRGVSAGRQLGLVAETQEAVKRALPTGCCSIAAIADHLALHPRTLQRRLSGLGTSFEEIVDSVRRDLATEYLRNTDMPLSALARMVGYSEQSSLNRSCIRWFGRSPRALRTASG